MYETSLDPFPKLLPEIKVEELALSLGDLMIFLDKLRYFCLFLVLAKWSRLFFFSLRFCSMSMVYLPEWGEALN